MSGRLSDEDVESYEAACRATALPVLAKDDLLGLLAEVRERRAAEQRVRGVLAEWDETEPEDGWGRLAEEITAALGETK